MASGGKRKIDSSAIVEMEVIGSDESDYEVDFSGDRKNAAAQGGIDTPSDQQAGKEEDLKGQISKGVATYVWEEGRQRARKAFSLYANIDILRPYYDVEPHEVRSRLLNSLVPKLTITPTEGRYPKVPRELYGPTMLVFTLIAMLLYQMKSSDHKVQEGTLMGTALATCFGYWFGISSVLWVMSYVCNTRITMTQILNVLGYALFGHCIVLFLTTLIHPSGSHLLFYLLWLSVGGLSTLKMVTLLMARTPGRSQKFVICGVVALIHLLFLLYLHFAYHHVVEDVSDALNGINQPAWVSTKSLVFDAAGVKESMTKAPFVELPKEPAADPVTLKHIIPGIRSNSSVLHRLSARDTRHLDLNSSTFTGSNVMQDSFISSNSSVILSSSRA